MILKLGGEGGSLTLFGRKNDDGGRTFFRESQESAMKDVLNEEDQNLSPLLNPRTRMIGCDLELALRSLGRHWKQLRPAEIHPDFRWSIYKLIMESRASSLYHWQKLCLKNNPLYQLAEWISSSKHTVVLSGAGMSTESGLPDFRSRDGWWRNMDPHKVANVTAIEENYELFWGFYKYRIETVEQYSPHIGHRILAKWEKNGWIHGISTQNVDGYHVVAGNHNIVELHGNIRSIRCHYCGRSSDVADFLNRLNCSSCQGPLRPNVVLFGEMLPDNAWNQAFQWFNHAELVLVIGTSLQVAPANQLPCLTSGHTVYMNMEMPEELDPSFDLMIKGKVGQLLAELDEMLDYIHSGKEE
ncbi:NAD-dependent protein deacetylase [compost metagenome]